MTGGGDGAPVAGGKGVVKADGAVDPGGLVGGDVAADGAEAEEEGEGKE
jgi:hypothetical protein